MLVGAAEIIGLEAVFKIDVESRLTDLEITTEVISGSDFVDDSEDRSLDRCGVPIGTIVSVVIWDVDWRRPELETTEGATIDVFTEGSVLIDPIFEEIRDADGEEVKVRETDRVTPDEMLRLGCCDSVLVR